MGGDCGGALRIVERGLTRLMRGVPVPMERMTHSLRECNLSMIIEYSKTLGLEAYFFQPPAPSSCSLRDGVGSLPHSFFAQVRRIISGKILSRLSNGFVGCNLHRKPNMLSRHHPAALNASAHSAVCRYPIRLPSLPLKLPANLTSWNCIAR